MLAYTNFDYITIIWVTGSALGLVAAIWHGRESWLDRKALRTAQIVDPAKENINSSAIVQEVMRLAVHIVFIGVGIIAMFSDPAKRGPVLGNLVLWTFILVPAWIALASIVALGMRKRLEVILANSSVLTPAVLGRVVRTHQEENQ